jgi:hypothetical protein
MKDETTVSRRTVLAGVPAVAAAAVPTAALSAIPAIEDDPTFALIEEHKEAMRTLSAAYREHSRVEKAIPLVQRSWAYTAWNPEPPEGCTDPPEWIATEIATRDACRDEDDVLFELLTTEPTTLAGAIAALEYVASPKYPDNRQHKINPIEIILVDAGHSFDEELKEAAAQFPALIAAALRKLSGVQS